MTLIIGVVSQKGGVGKSTLARAIAREYANSGWDVKIADLDISQSTSFNWNSRRLQSKLIPTISVEQFGRVSQAIKKSTAYDLVVFDGAPSSNVGTLEVAKNSDLIIIPTGTALDDLEPAVKLAHELKKKGTDKKKIVFVLSRVGTSQVELTEAEEYLQTSNYQLIKGNIPEKTAFRRASDLGQTLTETSYSTLNKKVDGVLQNIVDYLSKIQK